MSDPYGNSNPYGSNNQLTDPYARRDPYAARDPFVKRDPYALNDPYEKKDPFEKKEKKSYPCEFWFGLKSTMQDIFNADAALHEEKRVLLIDRDLFRLRFFANMTAKTIGATFVIFLVLSISLLLSAGVASNFKTIIVVLDLLLMAWLLYCPAHQTFSSYQYAVSENSINFYKLWRGLFNGYQIKIILSYLLVFATLGYFIKDDRLIQYFYNYLSIVKYNPGESFYAFLYILIPNAIGLLLYFVFAYFVIKKAEEQREINYRENVVNRKLSEVEKMSSVLDS